MKQTNVEKGKERLVINLSIKKGSGYSAAKEIATRFRENKMKYNFSQTSNSSIFIFENFYIKLFYSKYENEKVEICVKKVLPGTKGILDSVMDIISNIVETSEKNNIFLSSHSKFSANENMLILNEKDGKIYDVPTNFKYELNVVEKGNNKHLGTDKLSIIMPIKKSMVSFIPNLLSKFFVVAEKSREEILEKIERS